MDELRSCACAEHVASAEALEPKEMAVSTEAEMRRIRAFILAAVVPAACWLLLPADASGSWWRYTSVSPDS